MKIRLVDVAGEFCTLRSSPSLLNLRQLLRDALAKDQRVEISLEGVKILTPSFIDELLPEIILEFGRDKVTRLVVFSPELKGYMAEQIDRGVKASQQRRP